MSAPEAMTFETLKTDIQVYAERSDPEFSGQLDRFIMLAEQRLALEAKGLGFVRVVQNQFSPENPIVLKPGGWRQTKSFMVYSPDGSVSFLRPRTLGFSKIYSSGESSSLPEFYSNFDYTHFYVARSPDQNYTFELSYFERPEPLSDQNQVNWTTVFAPQLLLYASLLEAQPFLKNNTQLTVWQSQYAQILASLQREGSADDHDLTEAVIV